MSRIGKQPILLPQDVKITLDNDLIIVHGPKGELKRKIHPKILLEITEKNILVTVSDETRECKALHGLFRVLINNMVNGVTKGFKKSLEIVGVGYKAEINGKTAVLNLGYSHTINYELPKGIDATIEKSIIHLTGIDKELLGETAAKIRSFRKPEPYKGKGVRYLGETVRRKVGKSGSK